MSELTLYKLPSNWIWTSIGDLVSDIQPGFASGKKDVIGGLSHLRMDNITSSCTLDITSLKRVPPKLAKSRHILMPGDILFCHTNSKKLVGKTALFNLKDGKYAFSNHLTRLRLSKDGCIPEWILYGLAILWYNRYFETKCKQWVNQATIVKGTLLSAPIPLPPLEEQKRILYRINELFSESKIAKTSLAKIQPTIKEFRNSTLFAAFKGNLTERDPNDEPAEKLLERIRSRETGTECDLMGEGKIVSNFRDGQKSADSLNKLPQGWIRVRVGNICKGIVPGRYKPKEFNGHIPWITLPDVQGLYVSKSQKNLALTEGETHRVGMKVMPKGTVLMSCIGKFGIICIANCQIVPNQQFHAFVCQDDIIPEYVAYSLMTQVEQMKKLSTATTISYMNQTKCNSIGLPVAPIPEQRRIVEKIQYLFRLADQVEKAAEEAEGRLSKIDSAILTKAFHGELIPQDPNDEPASILLKRIESERKKESKVTKSNEFNDNLKQATLN